MKNKSILLSGLMILFCISFSFAQSGYLKIGDIDGESTERAHKDWIIIEGFSQGIAAAEQAATGAARQRTTVVFEELMITKKIDKATPKLMELCAKGQVVPELEMDMVTANGRLYYKITLSNVRIKSIRTTTGEPDRNPIDEVAFSFTKITWEYWDSAGNKTETTYNLQTNR